MVLEEQYPQLDSGRLLKLCLVHNLGEALGEPPEQDEGAEAGGESENERRALLALVDPFPEALKEKIVAPWEEYEAAEPPEARLVKGLDRLETLLQHVQGDNPSDFDYESNLEYGREYTSGDPALEGLRDAIDATTRQLADEH